VKLPYATLVLVLLSGCGERQPEPRPAAKSAAAPSVRSFDRSTASARVSAQYDRLEWDRLGDWRSVRISHHSGAYETILVARDPFGDRLMMPIGRGERALWRGRLSCPQGMFVPSKGVAFKQDGSGRRPLPAYSLVVEPSERAKLCDTTTSPITGTPSAVASGLSSGRVMGAPTAEQLKAMGMTRPVDISVPR